MTLPNRDPGQFLVGGAFEAIDRIERTVDRLDTKFDTHVTDSVGIYERVSRLEGGLAALRWVIGILATVGTGSVAAVAITLIVRSG